MEGWSTHYVWWPDRREGPFRLGLTFAPVDERMECIGVDVHSFELRRGDRDPRPFPHTEPQAVSTSLLRSIPLGRLIDEVRDFMTEHPVERYGPRGELTAEQLEEVRRAWSDRRSKGGRPPVYSFEHFEEVAQVYRKANELNRTPTRAVWRHFQERDPRVTLAMAAKWVAKCRRLGLLPPTTRGKARSAAVYPDTVRAEATIPGVGHEIEKGRER